MYQVFRYNWCCIKCLQVKLVLYQVQLGITCVVPRTLHINLCKCYCTENYKRLTQLGNKADVDYCHNKKFKNFWTPPKNNLPRVNALKSCLQPLTTSALKIIILLQQSKLMDKTLLAKADRLIGQRIWFSQVSKMCFQHNVMATASR